MTLWKILTTPVGETETKQRNRVMTTAAVRKIPRDHQKPAAQLEAEGAETTDVTWRGLTFTVASDPDDWPVDAVMAFEKGQNFVGLEIMLGAKQWAQFMKTKPLKRDGIDLFEVIGEALGLGD